MKKQDNYNESEFIGRLINEASNCSTPGFDVICDEAWTGDKEFDICFDDKIACVKCFMHIDNTESKYEITFSSVDGYFQLEDSEEKMPEDLINKISKLKI
jgi:hypothetical protein